MQQARVAVCRSVRELRSQVAQWRAAGGRVGLIPTLGALHAGHLELVRTAKRHASHTITSIFVNPAQFAPTEDFDTYPRTFEDDQAKLASVGCDLIWAPTKAEMYPDGFATYVVPGGTAEGLETEFRSNFFRGVATVCLKLFTQSGADSAVFGEKDYQQLCVIRQMVRDLNLPLRIVAAPTVREADGLAMSSRNRNLSDEERGRAATLYAVIARVAEAARAGADVAPALAAGERALSQAGFGRIDYLTVRDALTLRDWTSGQGRVGRVLAAAWLGQTRLIDNVAVPVSAEAAGTP